MLFYIDYLDYIISGNNNRSLQSLELRLKFDLLVFSRDTLCISVPACIKLENTTKLLMELNDFWSAGKIVLQLDKKHMGKPSNYFNNRKKILERGMPEEQLLKHFEFIAYESKRTDTFFNVYLPEIAGVTEETIYIDKKKDTDALFRQETIHIFEKNIDTICRALEPERAANFVGIFNRVQSSATNMNTLFERAVIEDSIIKEYQPRDNERSIVANFLDCAFAVANAYTSDAVPISLVLNQLTGKWLSHLLKNSYKELYDLIAAMSWGEILLLCQNDDWRKLIEYINAYIFIVQDTKLKEREIPIEAFMNQLSHSQSLLSLIHILKEEALNALKYKLYAVGLFSEAQNMEFMVSACMGSYSGRYKAMLDAVNAIDMFANRLFEYLTKGKQYSYLLTQFNSRNERKYEILEPGMF